VLVALAGYGRRAYAGEGCTQSGDTIYCGIAFTDTVNFEDVDNAAVVTQDGFSVDASSSYGIYITGDGDLSFTDEHGSSVSGQALGLYMRSRGDLDGPGSVVIETNGTISGSVGIGAYSEGTGGIVVTADGTLTGINGFQSGIGIRAWNFGASGDIEITTGSESKILADGVGIDAHNESGATTITVNGEVGSEGANDIGVRAAAGENSSGRIDITTAVGSTVSGAEVGIRVFNEGDGGAAVIANGNVYAGDRGIVAGIEGGAGDLTITTGVGSTVTGLSYGIDAWNDGSGATEITVNGDVGSEETDYGINVSGGGDGPVSIEIGATGTVTGEVGIYIEEGPATVMVAGDVEGTSGTAILFDELNDHDDTLELRAGATIVGAVRAGYGDEDKLVLGGDIGWGTFDVSEIDDGGETEKYQGFELFSKTGAGSWTLIGETDAIEAFSIEAGTLFVDGAMSETAFDVASITVLAGSGTVGGFTAHDNAWITPGDGSAPGTLSVAGDATFEEGAWFGVIVGPEEASRLAIAGSADLGGATVAIRASEAEEGYSDEKDYLILSAAEGYGDSRFAEVDNNFAFYDAALDYRGDDVYLTLTRNGTGYEEVSGTPNQAAVAGAIEGLGAGNPIYETIEGLSEEGAQEAFETLSGNALGSVRTMVQSGVAAFDAVIDGRIAAVETAAGGAALAYGAAAARPDPAALALAEPFAASGFWMRGTGTFGAVEGDGNAAGADYRMGGVAAGADTWLTPVLLAGIAFDYAAMEADFDDDRGSASVSSYALGLYARYAENGLRLDGKLGYGLLDSATSRRVVVGADEYDAKGDFDGGRFTAALEAGYDLAVAGTTLRPIAALGYMRLDEDGFTETGADIYNLAVDDRTTESLKSGLGVELSRSFSFAERADGLTLTARALWQHEFLDDKAAIDAAFADFAGSSFGVEGVSVARDSAVLGLGLTARASADLSLFTRYDTRLNPDQVDHAASAGIRLGW